MCTTYHLRLVIWLAGVDHWLYKEACRWGWISMDWDGCICLDDILCEEGSQPMWQGIEWCNYASILAEWLNYGQPFGRSRLVPDFWLVMFITSWVAIYIGWSSVKWWCKVVLTDKVMICFCQNCFFLCGWSAICIGVARQVETLTGHAVYE